MKIVFKSIAVAAVWLGSSFADQRPNIIFVLTDDHTSAVVGCYGNKDVITPNLDTLAKEGTRFTNYYTTSAICMASRVTYMTGLYEHKHGCNFTHGNLQQKYLDKSYPVLLRNAGYFVAFAGKLGFTIDGKEKQFDELLPTYFDAWAGGKGQTKYETRTNPALAKYAQKYPHATRAMGAWAVDTIKAAKQAGKPFCISLSFKAPHEPFDPDPIDLKAYDGKKFSLAPNWGPENAKYIATQALTSRGYTSNLRRMWTDDFQITAKKYYALITGVDAALGMIRKGLEEEGLSKNTVIIYTADNGYSCGVHGMGDKVLPYEEASKPPFIVLDPRPEKQVAGSVSDSLVANVDVFPTILSLAGVPAPEDYDGLDISQLLNAPNKQVRDYLPLFNFWGTISSQSLAIVTPNTKYIYWYYGNNGLQPKEEVFDLSSDRYEQKPLNVKSPELAPLLGTMRAYYKTELNKISTEHVNESYKDYGALFDPAISPSSKPKVDEGPVVRALDTIAKGGRAVLESKGDE